MARGAATALPWKRVFEGEAERRGPGQPGARSGSHFVPGVSFRCRQASLRQGTAPVSGCEAPPRLEGSWSQSGPWAGLGAKGEEVLPAARTLRKVPGEAVPRAQHMLPGSSGGVGRPAPLSQPCQIVTALWKSWGWVIFGDWNTQKCLKKWMGFDLSWFLEHSAGR